MLIFLIFNIKNDILKNHEFVLEPSSFAIKIYGLITNLFNEYFNSNFKHVEEYQGNVYYFLEENVSNY